MNIDSSNNTKLILLADDDADDRFLFESAMEDICLKLKLVAVCDGEKVINWLDATMQLPEIIFLDMNMPCKNGAECLAEIKQNERLKHIPVVIISTSLEPGLVKSLRNEGALFYIKKPNRFSDLKVLLSDVFDFVLKGKEEVTYNEKFVLTVNKS